MKKISCLLLFAFCTINLSYKSNASSTYGEKAIKFSGLRDNLKFGIGTGYSYGVLTYLNDSKTSHDYSKLLDGVPISLFAEYRFNKGFIGVRSQLTYSFLFPKESTPGNVPSNLLILDMPIRFYVSKNRCFFLGIGPHIIYVTKLSADISKQYRDKYRKLNAGLLLELGYDFDFGLNIGYIGRLSVTQYDTESDDLNFIGSGGLYLGYNFGRLLL